MPTIPGSAALVIQPVGRLVEQKGLDLILSGGPPGIGCPVISALSGTDLAIIVTEPTVSGRHDLERVLELCKHFKIPAGVIINKCDLNQEQAEGIEAYCKEKLTGYKVPKYIEFRASLPKSMVGKVLRRELVLGKFPTADRTAFNRAPQIFQQHLRRTNQ